MMREIDTETLSVNWQEMALRKEAMMMADDGKQLIDNGGVVPPKGDMTDEMREEMMPAPEEMGHPHHHPHHHGEGPHPHPHHHDGESSSADETEMEMGMKDEANAEHMELVQWMENIQVDIKDARYRMNYGLWFSKLCVGEAREEMINMNVVGEEESMVGDKRVRRDDGSSHSGDHHGKHGKETCMKISTHCALSQAVLFADFSRMDDTVYVRNMLSYRNMGGASLKEQRIELSVGLGLLIAGLIFGLVAFRKSIGSRCVASLAVLAMLLGAFFILLPVIRVAHWNHHNHKENATIRMHVPYSVIASGFGGILALITGLIAALGLCAKKRDQPQAGKWYQFKNENDEPIGEEKKSPLVFYNDMLPTKSGLYDAVDFSNIKPLETMLEKPQDIPSEA